MLDCSAAPSSWHVFSLTNDQRRIVNLAPRYCRFVEKKLTNLLRVSHRLSTEYIPASNARYEALGSPPQLSRSWWYYDTPRVHRDDAPRGFCAALTKADASEARGTAVAGGSTTLAFFSPFLAAAAAAAGGGGEELKLGGGRRWRVPFLRLVVDIRTFPVPASLRSATERVEKCGGFPKKSGKKKKTSGHSG